MIYTDEAAAAILAEPRYKGVVRPAMARVWKTRNVIPDQYFNPLFVTLTKANEPKAAALKDKFYNEKFTLKFALNPAQIVEHDKVLKALSSPVFAQKKLTDLLGISQHLVTAARHAKDNPKHVYLRWEHLLQIKKSIQEVRIEAKAVVEAIDKHPKGGDKIERILFDFTRNPRVNLRSLYDMQTDSYYYHRFASRRTGNLKDPLNANDLSVFAKGLGVFLLETSF